MRSQGDTGKTPAKFLNIPDAARQCGYSARHFRRIIEENRIPVLHVGRKIFILARDLEAWKSTQGEGREAVSYQQT